MSRALLYVLFLGSALSVQNAWSQSGPRGPIVRERAKKNHNVGQGQGPEQSTAPKSFFEIIPFLKDPLVDIMDDVLSFAARCPPKDVFIRTMKLKLKNNPLISVGATPDSCEKMDFSKLDSIRRLRLSYHIDLAGSGLPENNIVESLRAACLKSFEGEDMTAELDKLHTFACAKNELLVGPPSHFDDEDYQAAFNADHPRHTQFQHEVDDYAKQFSDSPYVAPAPYADPNVAAIASKGWNPEYDNTIKSALENSPLLNPSGPFVGDLLRMCPGFGELSKEDKMKVWTGVFDSMAMAESSHKPSTTFQESFGPLSTGMLQISQASANDHHRVCMDKGGNCNCKGATTNGLKDPNFNLACGVTVMENQMRTGRKLFATPSYYWSVLNTKQNGFPKVMGRLKAIKSDANRWPQACGS